LGDEVDGVDGIGLPDVKNEINASTRIQLLGPARAWDGEREVSLGPPRQRALFAVLALCANLTVSRHELIEAIWGGMPPPSAAGSVHTYVSALRNALEPDRPHGQICSRIISSGRGYLLRLAEGELDVQVFESGVTNARRLAMAGDSVGVLAELDACLRLWQGVALAGLQGPFAETERARLTDLRLSVVEERAEAQLALGRHADVAAELIEIVRAEPLRERPRGQLMLAMYRCGRQAEALAEFDRGRRLLNEQLGVDPTEDLQVLHRKILNADSSLNEPPEIVRPTITVAPSSVLAQLPHDVYGFVGRSEELDRITRWSAESKQAADGSAVLITAIDGAGGIGKSALAIRFAHQVASDYPDGQLYVNLRGFDRSRAPLTTSEALSQLLKGLGVTRVPTESDALEALYRTILAGRRVLILLDNAIAADQVRSLLPGSATCLVLVTSRNRLSGLVARDGARRVDLGLLTPEQSVELLGEIIGRDRIEADLAAGRELARLCGYLPLALRVAADRLACQPDLTLQSVVIELSNEHDRLDLLDVDDDEDASVRAVFSWSYQSLKPELARAFRRLGLHPGSDLTVSVAAALIGVCPAEAQPLLETLTSRHLLEHAGRRRYRFHDLLRVYASELAVAEESSSERAAVVRRVLNWYLHGTMAALSVATPHASTIRLDGLEPDNPSLTFNSAEDAFAWYETEYPNLIGAIRLAANTGNDQMAWKQAWGMFDYFYASGLLTDWISVLELGLTSAESLADLTAQGRILNQLGIAHSRIGHHEEAIKCLERALALFREIGNQALQSAALGNLGSILREVGRYTEGLGYAQLARDLARATDSQYFETRALDTLCDIYLALELPELALTVGRQGVLVARTSGSKLIEANLLINLGHAYRDSARPDEAQHHYDQAAQICRSIGDRYHEALTLFGMAQLEHRTGDSERARESAARARAIFESLHAEEVTTVQTFIASLDAA
jgi:DNA-binding SARP family transcriptional activator/tetratricopeptide (TPR) repeat protein